MATRAPSSRRSSAARARRIKQRVTAWCTAALVVALTVLALLASIGAARSDAGPGPRPPAAVTLTTPAGYAPGFADAKADDCQQGFKPACDWLRAAAKK